jgi:hypothetical protein
MNAHPQLSVQNYIAGTDTISQIANIYIAKSILKERMHVNYEFIWKRIYQVIYQLNLFHNDTFYDEEECR